MEAEDNRSLRILKVILGVIIFVLGMTFVVNPELFSWLTGFLVWIIGLFLIIAGIIEIITKSDGSKLNGVIALIVGLLYTIIGNFIKDPRALGALIGIWLLITGVLMLFMKE